VIPQTERPQVRATTAAQTIAGSVEGIAQQTAADADEPGKLERWILIAIILFLDSFLHLITTHVAGSWDQESSPLAQLAWTLLYFWAFIGLVRRRARTIELIKQSWPLVALIVVILASTFWSTFPDLTAKRAFGLFGTSLIGFYIATRFKLATFLECLVLSTGIAAVLSVLAILFVHRIGIMQNEYAGAWQGIYGHKNVLAAAMVFGIMNALLLAIASTGPRRRIYIALLVLFTGLLAGSRSATSMLIAVTMVALIIFTLLMKSRRHAAATGMAIVIGAAVVAIAIPALGIDTQAFFDLLGRDSTLTGRTDIWPYAIEAIGDRPLLGWGYKAFWLDNGPVQQYITSDWLPFHAHNGFLELSIDVGMVGTGFFVIGWILGAWRGLRMVISSNGSIPLWPLMTGICFILSNITEASIATYNTFQWVIYLSAFLYAVEPRRTVPAREFTYGSVEPPAITAVP
jgi:exopolysaccharide production protein ExoQ